MEGWQEKLQQQLHDLPDQPGVYLMRNGEGQVIYVGKATSLKSRVRSYFHAAAGKHPKTAALVQHIRSLEVMVVPTPVDALILESNLIKKYRPRYNVQLKDDKHYPYLKLTLAEAYPRLLIARSVKPNDGNRYFGPYSKVSAMHNAEKVIREIFPLRTCGNGEFRSRKRPCLNYQIKRCSAPCVGEISQEDYRQIVEQVALFLEGRSHDIVKDLRQQMEACSQQMRFEEAAVLRDRINSIEMVQRRQQMDCGSSEDRDVWGIASGGDTCIAQVFFVRDGKLSGREPFTLVHTADLADEEVLADFLPQYYSDCEFIPGEVCVPAALESQEELEALLQRWRGKKVTIHCPVRGDKKRLLELAKANATLLVEQKLKSAQHLEQQAETAMEELRQALALPANPNRIECYDISHFQGAYTVASQVTFVAGRPKKTLYRHYRIKTVEGVDDFASMREVIIRRLRRGLEERQALRDGALSPQDAKMAEFPDLMLIDGGKGQLSAVCDIIETMGIKEIPVFGLAKREEEIFRPHCSDPIVLDKHSAGLQLLQRVRDEAHRFAITYHRSLRQKGQVKSLLDDIPGIGEKRRQALWKAFGTIERIKEADLTALATVEGMNLKAAESVYDFLHKGEPEA